MAAARRKPRPILLEECCPAVQYAVQLSFLMGNGAAIGYSKDHQLWTARMAAPRSIHFFRVGGYRLPEDVPGAEPEEVEWFPCDHHGHGVWTPFLLHRASAKLKAAYRASAQLPPLTFYGRNAAGLHYWARIAETQQVYYCTAYQSHWRPCYPPPDLDWQVLPAGAADRAAPGTERSRFTPHLFALLPRGEYCCGLMMPQFNPELCRFEGFPG